MSKLDNHYKSTILITLAFLLFICVITNYDFGNKNLRLVYKGAQALVAESRQKTYELFVRLKILCHINDAETEKLNSQDDSIEKLRMISSPNKS